MQDCRKRSPSSQVPDRDSVRASPSASRRRARRSSSTTSMRRAASAWCARSTPRRAGAVLRRRRVERCRRGARSSRFALDGFGDLDIVVNNAGTTHRNQPMLDVAEEEFDRIYGQRQEPVPHRAARGAAFPQAGTACSSPSRRPPACGRGPGSPGTTAARARRSSRRARWRPSSRPTTSASTSSIRWPARPACSPISWASDTPEIRAKFVASIPLGRLSLPSDIATAAVFFASDEAAFITGACLEVDGGRCV